MNKVTQCYNCGMPRFHGVAGTVPQPADGYRIAVDTELVCAHIGVTNLEDDYETARKKLNDLICWNIQVDRDLEQSAIIGKQAARIAELEDLLRSSRKFVATYINSTFLYQNTKNQLAKIDEALSACRASMGSKGE